MISPDVQRWLDLLPIVANRKWVIHPGGAIRTEASRAVWVCPLCALANEVQGEERWGVAAIAATLQVFNDVGGTTEFVHAADYSSNPNQTRRAMLAILKPRRQ